MRRKSLKKYAEEVLPILVHQGFWDDGISILLIHVKHCYGIAMSLNQKFPDMKNGIFRCNLNFKKQIFLEK